MRLAIRQQRSRPPSTIVAVVLAVVCLLELHLLQRQRMAGHGASVPGGNPTGEPQSLSADAAGPLCEGPDAQRQVASLQQLVKQPSAAALVEAVAAGVEGGTWLQIGANTMDASLNSNDPVMKLLGRIPSWRKLFVEPIPHLFRRLEESVRRWPNSTAINLAVSPDASTTTATAVMYCLKEGFDTERLGKDIPAWVDQICSFEKRHITKHFPAIQTNTTKTVAEVSVTAVSLAELMRRYDISAVDVLLIDTEGFDYHVLQQIPFHLMRPRLVLWEHSHLKERRALADELMRRQCYAVWELSWENSAALALYA